MKKVLDPFNIHLDAFWGNDLRQVEKMVRKLDSDTLKKLYGMKITVTADFLFPHPKTGEPMAGLTRSLRGKPYLIILGKKPNPLEIYHEVAHAIGIDDETEAMNFAKEKERKFYRM